MAAEAKVPFDAALDSVLSSLERKFTLKEEQLLALKHFVTKKGVFALLPTGFGKSLIYQLAPLVAKAMGLRLLPRRTSVALHTSSGIIEMIGYELGTGAFDRHS